MKLKKLIGTFGIDDDIYKVFIVDEKTMENSTGSLEAQACTQPETLEIFLMERVYFDKYGNISKLYRDGMISDLYHEIGHVIYLKQSGYIPQQEKVPVAFEVLWNNQKQLNKLVDAIYTLEGSWEKKK